MSIMRWGSNIIIHVIFAVPSIEICCPIIIDSCSNSCALMKQKGESLQNQIESLVNYPILIFCCKGWTQLMSVVDYMARRYYGSQVRGRDVDRGCAGVCWLLCLTSLMLNHPRYREHSMTVRTHPPTYEEY